MSKGKQLYRVNEDADAQEKQNFGYVDSYKLNEQLYKAKSEAGLTVRKVVRSYFAVKYTVFTVEGKMPDKKFTSLCIDGEYYKPVSVHYSYRSVKDIPNDTFDIGIESDIACADGFIEFI